MRSNNRRPRMRSVALLSSLMCLALVASACGSSGGVTGMHSNSMASASGADGSSTASGATTDTSGASGTGATSDTGGTTLTGDAAFGWKNYQGSNAIQTGHLKVPIDYKDPSKGTFNLFVVKHRATDPSQRIGSLLVNPGGPGAAGTGLAFAADQEYSQDLNAHFDIIGWDPRGTGASTPAIDCISNYDKFFDATDITPDTPAERQQIIDLAKEFETDCVTKNAKILQFIGTNNSARDVDSIRKALGEDKISYFGFSYGSELGATWATLFPTTVRAAVLDGAVDPNASLLEGNLEQTKGFEASIDTFLQDCSNDSGCPFNNGGNAAAAFDTLMAKIDANPLPTEAGRPPLTRGAALQGVAEAMYLKSFWPQLQQALADAQKGKGKGLLDLYDQYYRRNPDGTYDNLLEAFQTISCMDTKDRPTVAEDDATAPQFNKIAPRFAPGTTGSYFCTFYPATQDPWIKVTGKGAGPIVVVGTTGDPATPLASSQKMAAALEGGVLLTVVADQHTGYGVNQCSFDQVDGYLINLTVPPAGTRCG